MTGELVTMRDDDGVEQPIDVSGLEVETELLLDRMKRGEDLSRDIWEIHARTHSSEYTAVIVDTLALFFSQWLVRECPVWAIPRATNALASLRWATVHLNDLPPAAEPTMLLGARGGEAAPNE